jgi:hypothetical protein
VRNAGAQPEEKVVGGVSRRRLVAEKRANRRLETPPTT